MPLVTVTVRKPTPAVRKRAILDAVHDALVASGVPVTDRFQRLLELDAADFVFDPRYPDLATDRGEDFVLIEILWSVGRSVKVKRQLLAGLLAGLAGHDIDGEHVMVVFKETAWENWAFGGGRILHA
ncbi:tautomerase family protein [Dokdonella fugitiva]|jgi:phenylpyruvate tautomerase PptA (4-oxalocrotonate tautomerase family)|uniref:Tautomerase-like protein n=1 Tax=Dokdonella fugitiva TaxID=328517 RepID=A0A4R2HZ62_9GAMM|nr:tautomerase family protein [Dokdonella fugitiva]TCO36832.1 tautomerase-like protein [Dokdonella fugitiva]